MHTIYRTFYSEKLGREMPFKTYGHAGKPMVVFPSSGGRFFEYEDFGMVEACRPFIEDGLIRLYTLDSVDNDSWLNRMASPLDRARYHNAYDAYVVNELIPSIRYQEPWSEGIISTGCSMGGYHAANFFFRHPDVFDSTIALSGIYDLRMFVGDQISHFDVYINSPVDYLKFLTDPWYLERYKAGRIILCTGQGAWEEEAVRDTRLLESILREKGIPAMVDYWGYDVNHDWAWWRLQIPYFLGKLFGNRGD